ncbi:enolase [Pyrococcus furiosus DSM 3638]|uniref:Enolase n=3 Tax=Pyrococcus furiosus TaxID=2261 RepID=ENO_PYRFU|nr:MULTISPECIES: phosphopyruvate hydratase [Pyrococcus]Q8U477.1 RecName: Full=Enolase; AltName: Full=2-phospho-D-glycerate hydro-lyase; AltName: Full=2-phosphoglycerate dehydratase [Pyrococcus furiosus DSM 3638]AAL80339.1 enolase (2-phosphoglycerate dehydratase) [Pyrococcus furiosus DSM 3638]AFN03003.1 enolase [Pyrococcus furiosus COM1]MDK2869223.1 enolase [Pyrococcus sp.]QEK77940.1 enolase [Pyrococcus furiosus DSM 3638]
MENPYEIVGVVAREILDSRGNPTVEVDVYTHVGMGRAAVPSGASTGTHEALELRDGGKRYHGKGVRRAVENVNKIIAPELIGMDVRWQREIDALLLELDGTENKSNVGANAILAVSLAVAKAAANSLELPLYQYLGGVNAYVLPVPLSNVINGGVHAGNDLDFQEFMIMPIGADSFREAIRWVSETYHVLKKVIMEKYGKNAVNVGDEGGFAPPMKEVTEPLDVLIKAIEEAGYKPGDEIALALDVASSELFNEETGKYVVGGKEYDRGELLELYKDLTSTYPIVSIEDPFHEEDWEGFVMITKELGHKVQIVGDDLFVTNPKRLRKGIELGAANALLLKVNQIGTLSEAMDAAFTAFRAGYGVIVSHRSGETEDATIADLAVALNAGQIKTGAPARSDRNAKYNQLIRIEEELEGVAVYAGKRFRKVFF